MKEIQLPIILVNYKAYKQAFGKRGLEIAKECERISRKEKVNIGVAVPSTELAHISQALKIPVLSEHFDPDSLGHHTGHIPIKGVTANGAVGSLINHSEHPMTLKEIKKAVEEAKRYKIKSVVCIPNTRWLNRIIRLKPDMIALEFPDLIGGKVSVSKEAPKIIRKAAKKTKEHSIAFLCGGGVHSMSDVEKAIEEGCDGALLASSVLKAKNPASILTKLCEGVRRGLKKVKE
jgi:triosephosphate isomerase